MKEPVRKLNGQLLARLSRICPAMRRLQTQSIASGWSAAYPGMKAHLGECAACSRELNHQPDPLDVEGVARERLAARFPDEFRAFVQEAQGETHDPWGDAFERLEKKHPVAFAQLMRRASGK